MTTAVVGCIPDVNEATRIIANLFTLTKDPVVKETLTKYNISRDDSSNYKSLKKQSVDCLRKTAQFLNHDESVNMLKDPLIDWIINRIKNLFPEKCRTCDQMYTINVADKSPVTCSICGQGIHTPCLIAKFGTDKLADMAGLHWFCSFCDPAETSYQEEFRKSPGRT